MKQLIPEIMELLEDRLGIVAASADEDLFDSGALDSLAFVNLLMEIETSFGIPIQLDEVDFEEFATVAGIAGFVQRVRARSVAEAS